MESGCDAVERNEESLFFLTFIGEYVQVTSNLMTKKQIETDEGVGILETPITIVGYLLDEDDKYYYMGGRPDSVSDAIKKTSVKMIQIVEFKTELDEVLDSMGEPEDEKEIN